MDNRKKALLLMSAVFMGVLVYFTIDIMLRTAPPWTVSYTHLTLPTTERV